MLKRIEIQNQPNSDTYRALMVFETGEKWIQADYATIGEAARDNFECGVPIFDCTGRKTANPRNRITRTIAESGELG